MKNWVYEVAFCVVVYVTAIIIACLLTESVTPWAFIVMGFGMAATSLIGRAQGRSDSRRTTTGGKD